MSHNEKDNLPPSYTETMGPPQSSLRSHGFSPSRGQALLDQLTLTRTTHIQSIITTHILPIVEQQASFGIAQTIIAMLPSDIPLPAVEEKSEFSFDTADTKAVEVIGFSSEVEPKVVRLEGQMNRTEFWRVQAVIGELERVLRESLNASAYLRSPTSPIRTGSSPFEEVARQPRRNFFSRMVSASGREERSPSGNVEMGSEQLDTNSRLVLVNARIEEICLRTVNEFGLYDTMAKQCVIVRVDAKC